jgi:hypothetical protein
MTSLEQGTHQMTLSETYRAFTGRAKADRAGLLRDFPTFELTG